jgi:hypothetical protein
MEYVTKIVQPYLDSKVQDLQINIYAKSSGTHGLDSSNLQTSW